MTREEEWQDPEIQKLLADLRGSIESYLHRKLKINPVPAGPNVRLGEMCNVTGSQPDALLHPQPGASEDEQIVKQLELPAA
jgi:hypothetical protein